MQSQDALKNLHIAMPPDTCNSRNYALYSSNATRKDVHTLFDRMAKSDNLKYYKNLPI